MKVVWADSSARRHHRRRGANVATAKAPCPHSEFHSARRGACSPKPAVATVASRPERLLELLQNEPGARRMNNA